MGFGEAPSSISWNDEISELGPCGGVRAFRGTEHVLRITCGVIQMTKTLSACSAWG